jgi:alpha-1,2-mannosyltransferase
VASTHSLRRPLAGEHVWKTVLRAAALATAVYAAMVFVIAPLTGHFSGRLEDFQYYWDVARVSAAHGDIYAAFTQQDQNVALSGFDYPPAVALVLTPLALLPFHTAATMWLLLEVAALVAGCILVARTVLPEAWPRVELAILAAFLFGPAVYNLWLGQMNPVIFLLLALALHSWVRGHEIRCGVFIGIAAAIKLAPIVLLILLLRRRWWKGAGATAAVLALSAGSGVLAFGVHTTVEYVQSVLPVLSRDDGWLYNQSWFGVVNRLGAHSVLAFEPGVLAMRVVELSLAAVSVLAAAWTVRSAETDPTRRGAQFGAGILAMLLAGSITWYSHDIHLLIPLAAGAALAASMPGRRRALVIALVAALVSTAVVARGLISVASMQSIVAVSQTPLWWPLLQLTSLPALSTALLLAATVAALRSEPGSRPLPAAARWRGLQMTAK